MFFHILGAIVWVGAVILMNAIMARASRDPDRTAVLRLSRELEWVGPWLIGTSSAVVIGAGIGRVFVEEGVALSSAQGIYSATEGKHVLRLSEERGAEDRDVLRRLHRLLWLARLDIVILVAVLWLMVFKPGGPAE